MPSRVDKKGLSGGDRVARRPVLISLLPPASPPMLLPVGLAMVYSSSLPPPAHDLVTPRLLPARRAGGGTRPILIRPPTTPSFGLCHP